MPQMEPETASFTTVPTPNGREQGEKKGEKKKKNWDAKAHSLCPARVLEQRCGWPAGSSKHPPQERQPARSLCPRNARSAPPLRTAGPRVTAN